MNDLLYIIKSCIIYIIKKVIDYYFRVVYATI